MRASPGALSGGTSPRQKDGATPGGTPALGLAPSQPARKASCRSIASAPCDASPALEVGFVSGGLPRATPCRPRSAAAVSAPPRRHGPPLLQSLSLGCFVVMGRLRCMTVREPSSDVALSTNRCFG